MKGYIQMKNESGKEVKQYIKYVKPEEMIEEVEEKNYYDPIQIDLSGREYTTEQLIPEFVFTENADEASSITEEQYAELQQTYPTLEKEVEHRKQSKTKKEEDKKEEKKKDEDKK